MANTPRWNIRLRHEWLATPAKGQRVKRRNARRIGLLDAWERSGKRKTAGGDEPDAPTDAAEGGSPAG
jgi:hypothetical protein